jgi:hypothetical protein
MAQTTTVIDGSEVIKHPELYLKKMGDDIYVTKTRIRVHKRTWNVSEGDVTQYITTIDIPEEVDIIGIPREDYTLLHTAMVQVIAHYLSNGDKTTQLTTLSHHDYSFHYTVGSIVKPTKPMEYDACLQGPGIYFHWTFAQAVKVIM